MTQGICYVAWGDKWLNEACRSSKSAQALGYKTCLLTDNTFDWTHSFDIQKQVDFSQFDGMTFFMKKWRCLTDTPFDVTCFLDTDTLVLDSLDLGFSLASQFGLCMTHSPGMLFHYDNTEYIHYNGGCMYFTGQRPDLLQQFCTVCEELKSTQLVGDEPIFSVAFRRFGINPCVLPSVFNCIRAGQIHDRQIKVFHSRFQPATFLASDQFGNEFTRN